MSKKTQGRSVEAAQAAEAAHETSSEALSSLIDGELEAGRCTGLLQKLCTDPQARRLWTLMHVTGDALRSSEVASLHSDAFVARVASALEAEPVIVAPHARRGSSRFVRRIALPGVAVAAAATVLVFVAVPQLRDPDTSPAVVTGPAQVAASTPVASTAGEPAVAAAPNGTVVIQRLPELDAYLAAHREQSGTSMMLRSTPYLRTSATVPR